MSGATVPPVCCPACGDGNIAAYGSEFVMFKCGTSWAADDPRGGDWFYDRCAAGWHAAAAARERERALVGALEIAREYVEARRIYVHNFGSAARKMEADADLKQIDMALALCEPAPRPAHGDASEPNTGTGAAEHDSGAARPA